MDKWKCHKVVEAFKIGRMLMDRDAKILLESTVMEVECDQVRMGMDWCNKHEPKVGGYFVRYEDGYESYSPAEAFEGGYSLIP